MLQKHCWTMNSGNYIILGVEEAEYVANELLKKVEMLKNGSFKEEYK